MTVKVITLWSHSSFKISLIFLGLTRNFSVRPSGVIGDTADLVVDEVQSSKQDPRQLLRSRDLSVYLTYYQKRYSVVFLVPVRAQLSHLSNEGAVL